MAEASAAASAGEVWPPPGCPPLAWPDLTDGAQRLVWYRAVIVAYAALWEGHVSAPVLRPATDASLDALETRLGCVLPPPLRDYHVQLGALSLGETLCDPAANSAIPIQRLAAAWPALSDLDLSEDERMLVPDLVVFGDYLGNGNMFCFHARTGAVHYVDHDRAPHLVRFFDSTADYLDALMLLTLAEVHEDDAAGEALLRQRYGDPLVQTWRY